MPNIYKPVFEKGERPEGFKSKRARIDYELGTEPIAVPDAFGHEATRAFFERGDAGGYWEGEKFPPARPR
jgi:hypothetical protein